MNPQITDSVNPQVTDCSTLQKDRVVETDVVVIGTGAGGGIAAQILAEAGRQVVMVEEGPYQTMHDFHMRESEAYPNLYHEVAARKTVDKAITILQGRAVGGGTTVNWTSCFRFPEQTLAHWRQQYGWQHDLTTLDPWHRYAEQLLNITPWPIHNPNNAAFADGAKKLGWHYETIARNVRGCLNLGYCNVGCPVGAKQSTQQVSIPAALQRGAQLYTRLRAERLITTGDTVSEVECSAMNARGSDPSGVKVRIRAKQIVVAAGGIGSPALLLRSQLPDPHQLTGKRTFLHLTLATAAVMPEKMNSFHGAPQTIHSNQFLWRDGVTGEMGYKLETVPMLPALSSTVFGSFGQQHADNMAIFSNMFPLIALLRDGFHEQSPGGTVKLNSDGTPVLDYPLNDYYWRAIRHAYGSMLAVQFAAGATQAIPIHSEAQWYKSLSAAQQAIPQLTMAPHRPKVFSAHVMGGCAMGADPKQSVVDLTGRHHHLRNLHVMDGSLFPSGIGVNPSLPIYAMAAALANGLLKG
ncbi:MAG: GMC family oxidoreductase [Gammaproteobacteria bacterium]|nr:GMC family oxidoreductase [Gammaproteobacteria bacterium]MDH5653566.1 GMC family oxidoreductase [Gammaproteobacteria bacterium]